MAHGLIGLAQAINEHNGMEGPELEAYVSFVAAGFADLMGRKDIGDHFEAKCKAAWRKHKGER